MSASDTASMGVAGPPTLSAIPEERHPTLWLSDGNIVLAAACKGKQSVTLFRVHKSILAMQSPIFKDMFEIASHGPDINAASPETYEGLPFVFIPDQAEYLEALLKVMYGDTWVLPFKQYNPDTPFQVIGPLVLATKYQMEALRLRIVTQLQHDWPSTLDGWDVSEDRYQSIKASHDLCPEKRPWLFDLMPDPASAIWLGTTCNVPQILPAAFYHLCRIKAKNDFDILFATPNFQDVPFVCCELYARWGLLSTRDLRVCLEAREFFNTQVHGSKYSNIFHPKVYDDVYVLDKIHSKRSYERCRDICQEIHHSFSSKYLSDNDVLGRLRSYTNPRLLGEEWGLCDDCADHVARRVKRMRQKVWDRLPRLFGIDLSKRLFLLKNRQQSDIDQDPSNP